MLCITEEEMCEILPGHRYLMPMGSTTCGKSTITCIVALCRSGFRANMRFNTEKYVEVSKEAAREARMGHRQKALDLVSIRNSLKLWIDLNPCGE